MTLAIVINSAAWVIVGYGLGRLYGLASGYQRGKKDGHDLGYAMGKRDGNAEGYTSGHAAGYAAGWVDSPPLVAGVRYEQEQASN